GQYRYHGPARAPPPPGPPGGHPGVTLKLAPKVIPAWTLYGPKQQPKPWAWAWAVNKGIASKAAPNILFMTFLLRSRPAGPPPPVGGRRGRTEKHPPAGPWGPRKTGGARRGEGR